MPRELGWLHKATYMLNCHEIPRKSGKMFGIELQVVCPSDLQAFQDLTLTGWIPSLLQAVPQDEPFFDFDNLRFSWPFARQRGCEHC